MIALDLEDLLLDAGFAIAGVAPNLAKALAMIEREAFEVAILDGNLGGVTASPTARALFARKLPFVVLSGYSASQQPPDMCLAPLVAKPVDAARLIEVLHGLLQIQGCAGTVGAGDGRPAPRTA